MLETQKFEVTIRRVIVQRVLVEVPIGDSTLAKNEALAHFDDGLTESVMDDVVDCAPSSAVAPAANSVPDANDKESGEDVAYIVEDVAWDGEVPGPKRLRVWVPPEMHVLRGGTQELVLEEFISDAITAWQEDTHCGFSYAEEITR